MKIIILSLVTVVLFVGCGSKNVSTIPESSARFLRKSNSQLIQVTDKTQLEMDDYVLFTTNTNKSISVEDIETKSQSPYTVASYSECKIMNKKFSYENHLTQNAIQLKSILPLEFFLSSNNSATCSFKITLQKDGSSKTFNFMGTTIKNINSSSEILLGNEKAEQLMTSPESILEKDLDHFTIAHTNKNDYVSLICENFRTEPVKIELDILKLGNVARLTRAISYAPYEIDPRSYIPNQDCVIHLKKENGIALLSPTFQMKFTVAEPLVKFIDNSTVKPNIRNWSAFYVELSNPKSHPVTVALDKTKLSLKVEIGREACGRVDNCRIVRGTFTNVPLTPSFSNQEMVSDQNNMILIHLKPGQSLRITFNMNINRKERTYWFYYDMNSKRDIMQNLRVNYQSMNDATASPEFIGETQSY